MSASREAARKRYLEENKPPVVQAAKRRVRVIWIDQKPLLR
jgi:hypothetical protein